jgi:hypothetical protein
MMLININVNIVNCCAGVAVWNLDDGGCRTVWIDGQDRNGSETRNKGGNGMTQYFMMMSCAY